MPWIQQAVTENHIADVVAMMTGIPVQKVAEKEIVTHIDKYKKAKELGESFAKEITDA